MIHPVRERLDMAVEHRAGAATAHLMPRPVNVQIFLGRFLAPGDGRADFLAKNFRATAGQRIQTGLAQFAERFLDRLFGQPRQVQNFNGRETFQLQPCIERAQTAEHVHVITERQGRMQSADDVQLGDPDGQRLARFLDHLRNRQLEAVLVAFLAGERAELAAQDAVVRIVDVAVDDVAGATAVLALVDKIRNGADGVQVFALEKPQGVGLGNPVAGGDFVADIAQLAALQKKVHRINRNHGNTISVVTAIKNTLLISALSRKNALLIHFKLRFRASQCSKSRLPRMMTKPTKYATRNLESNPKRASRAHMSRCDRKAALSALSGPQRTTSECRPWVRSNS